MLRSKTIFKMLHCYYSKEKTCWQFLLMLQLLLRQFYKRNAYGACIALRIASNIFQNAMMHITELAKLEVTSALGPSLTYPPSVCCCRGDWQKPRPHTPTVTSAKNPSDLQRESIRKCSCVFVFWVEYDAWVVWTTFMILSCFFFLSFLSSNGPSFYSFSFKEQYKHSA